MKPKLKRISKPFFLYFLLLFTAIPDLQAQVGTDTTQLYRVQTRDGNEYTGRIVHQDEEFILLKTTTIGEITIAKKDILRISPISPETLIRGEVWPENPQATRYFWMPNGYGLKSGEGYYQNVWIFFNQASVGVTDNISIGLGTVPLFLFGSVPSPFWITPKVSLPIVDNKLSLGAGALMGTVVGESKTGFGIAYGVGTLGSRDRNASIGIGYGYAGGRWATIPVISIGGMLRVGKNGYLLSENYVIHVDDDQTFALLMLGSRIMVKRVGIDFGLVVPRATGMNGYFALPWLGLSVPFNLKDIGNPRVGF